MHQQKNSREAEQERQWKQLQALRQQQQQQQHHLQTQQNQGKFISPTTLLFSFSKNLIHA